ncbi:PREDICTED: uncharacterized protein LOC104752976 [Camelina sativa]|uniref:Uncharacterized protein LOC104752976 n=1 Tax=Camelina sativa TaxID=90675 RepID=A0ABM0WN70_CAMSA|nr:PREDICTED: uncharacterized protein LOC104752976 [Camelina sativa]
METLFKEINSKANKARTNVDNFYTAYMKATNSDLADEAFLTVTNPIISHMGNIINTTKHIAYCLQVLRNTNSDLNFLQNLNAIDKMAVDVWGKSKVALDVMRKAIVDAKERKKARDEAQKLARDEEVRKIARNEPRESNLHYYRYRS